MTCILAFEVFLSFSLSVDRKGGVPKSKKVLPNRKKLLNLKWKSGLLFYFCTPEYYNVFSYNYHAEETEIKLCGGAGNVTAVSALQVITLSNNNLFILLK